VTAAVVTLAPGQETGWHTHGMPTFGYVLEGELEVDYGKAGVRVYRAGDAVLEAIGVAHNGRNIGAGPMRILAVFMGADGLATSEPATRDVKKKTAGMAGAPFQPLGQAKGTTQLQRRLAPQEKQAGGYARRQARGRGIRSLTTASLRNDATNATRRRFTSARGYSVPSRAESTAYILSNRLPATRS
jgi:hypothetical protein